MSNETDGNAKPVARVDKKTVWRSPWLIFAIIALVQLGLIFLPIVSRVEVALEGERVVLATNPVDPRALFRGDYVTVNLAISHLSEDLPGMEQTFKAGDPVFVILRKGTDGVAGPVAVSKSLPDGAGLVIRGSATRTGGGSKALAVTYGLQSYFLPEGEGKKIEGLSADQVRLEVALSKSGEAVAVHLLVDGKPLKP